MADQKKPKKVPLDKELTALLLEARDNAQASTAEDNISDERRRYRQVLYERLKAYCEKYKIKH